MKKKWFKRILALGAAALMGLSSLTVMAAEPGPTISIADQEYYKGLVGESAPETATINITKKVTTDVDNPLADEEKKPVKGVVFGVKKVGDIAQITTGDETYMAYGIQNSIVRKFKNPTLIPSVQDDRYTYYRDYSEINKELKQLEPQDLDNMDSTWKSTDENGEVKFENLEYGLYLVAEVNVSEAQIQNEAGEWENITITEKQYPYIVSAPIYDEVSEKWLAEVEAVAKNEIGTATMEKQIVRDYEDTLGLAGGENLKDTDVTEVGDTVEFRLTTTVPDLSNGDEQARVDSYVLEDNISKGLTLPEFDSTNIMISDAISQEYIFGIDYIVEGPEDIAAGAEGTIKEGKCFKVVFTESGLEKLTTLAHSQAKVNKQVFTHYIATVNADAVVGQEGNPNESRLTFSANGSGEVTTDWDKVVEYIFTMKANKTFDGATDNEKAKEIRFQLFTDKECKNGILVTGDNGVYTYAGKADSPENATEIKLDANSEFSIKGVPVETELYLKETQTASGWNLLKDPIKVWLSAENEEENKADGEYTGYLDKFETTVNDVAVLEDMKDDTPEVSFTVNNTSGFQLPSTGGMGATLFAAIGVLVIALGGAFYFVSSRKAKRN